MVNYLMPIKQITSTEGVVRINKGAGSRIVKEGERVVLECSVNGSRPIVVSWIRNNIVLQKRNDTENTSYVIDSVQLGDEGIYKCKASNIHGDDEYQVRLKIPTCRF